MLQIKMITTTKMGLKIRIKSYYKTDIKREFSRPKYTINHKSYSTVGQIVENVVFEMATDLQNKFELQKLRPHFQEGHPKSMFYSNFIDDKSTNTLPYLSMCRTLHLAVTTFGVLWKFTPARP